MNLFCNSANRTYRINEKNGYVVHCLGQVLTGCFTYSWKQDQQKNRNNLTYFACSYTELILSTGALEGAAVIKIHVTAESLWRDATFQSSSVQVSMKN